MKYMASTPWFLMTVAGVLVVVTATARAQRAVLLVGRDTGNISVTNPGPSFDVDGYVISSASGLLNPDGWNSLADQGAPGFVEANPRAVQLAEFSFTAQIPFEGGSTTNLGNGYVGGNLTPSQEDLTFQFTTPSGAVNDGPVKFTGPSQLPTVTVNRANGAVTLSNPAGFPIDGYSIASASGLLSPDTFAGLAAQNVAGWNVANPTTTLVSELNLTSALSFDGGATFSLGNPYGFATGVPLNGEDLTFEFSTPGEDGDVFTGVVNMVGPINDLVLEVDSISGLAKIQNLSQQTGAYELIGYSVLSESGAIDVAGWTGFSVSGAAGTGWSEANPTANAIAELNPSGSFVMDTGTSISIGTILGGLEDLVFEYATPSGTALGSVNYVMGGIGPLPGDCNGDGVVNAADLVCACGPAGDIDAVLAATGLLAGDLDGDGTVAFPDFLALSANFGKSGGGAAATAVPEPTAGMLALLSVLLFGIRHRRASTSES
jgi:hypothetical protein